MEEHVSTPHKESKQVSLSPTQAILANGFIIAIAIIIGAFIVRGTIFNGGVGAAQGTAEDSAKPTVAVDIKNVGMNGHPFIGNPQSKVVVAYWSDFQCPFCKKFETGPFQEIVKKYVATGKVAVVFKAYSFLGPDSDTAALYEFGVWNTFPDKFFEWRTAMYNAQDDENAGFGNEESVAKLTASIAGIDLKKVQADIKKNKDAYTKIIESDRQEGVDFGIQGTPSFITGTKLIPGYTEFSTFSKELDKQLK